MLAKYHLRKVANTIRATKAFSEEVLSAVMEGFEDLEIE
jgi:hypothetical protein